MDVNSPFRCPVCRAKFRSTRKCSRCGADLSVVMTIVCEAWLCRRNARRAVLSHDFQKARLFAKKAQDMHWTEVGRRLLALTSWLESS